MPLRTLSADLITHLSNRALTPIWLVELQVPAASPAETYRLCSTVDISSFNGYSWSQSNMTIGGPTVRAGAGLAASIVFIQNDALVTSFLGERWDRCTASLYFTYYDGMGIATPVLLLSGEVSDVSLEGKNLSISLTASGNRSNVTPWIRISPPLFNYLTARGTVLTWGIDKVVIDRE